MPRKSYRGMPRKDYCRMQGLPFHGKFVCLVCGDPVQAGQEGRHAACLRELDRRADAAIPNPRRKS
jgi:hypothetical protein